MVKTLPASAGDTKNMGSIPGLGRSPGERNGNSLQYFLPGKFHGQRSLVGYNPWGCKESDTTEHVHTHTQCTHTHTMPDGARWREKFTAKVVQSTFGL